MTVFLLDANWMPDLNTSEATEQLCNESYRAESISCESPSDYEGYSHIHSVLPFEDPGLGSC